MSRAAGHGRATAGDGHLGGRVDSRGGHLLARGRSDGRGGSAGGHLSGAAGSAGGDGNDVGGVDGGLDGRDSRDGAREESSGDNGVTHLEVCDEKFRRRVLGKKSWKWIKECSSWLGC